jgi:hypothetical protein
MSVGSPVAKKKKKKKPLEEPLKIDLFNQNDPKNVIQFKSGDSFSPNSS